MKDENKISFLAKFDARKFELPEGIAVDGDRIYAGLTPTRQIVRLTGDGAFVPFASLPETKPGEGLMTGMIVGPGQGPNPHDFMNP